MKMRKATGWGLVALPVVLLFVVIAVDEGVAFMLLVLALVIVIGSVVCAGVALLLDIDEEGEK